jgi:predicted aldo/keto reductase-like oxidoreductase
MAKNNKAWSRREFLKAAGAMGMAPLFASPSSLANASGKRTKETLATGIVPTRPFGKTGVDVSILSLGGSLTFTSRQRLLRQAFKAGVTYWDTAASYSGGDSEEGIGKYFSKYPEDREKVFLVTKSDSNKSGMMTDSLNESLERMKTSYIDLYFLHGISSTRGLNDRVRKWAEREKGKGKIRFFGFSTHRNMEECMIDGAKLGWIDGIMMTYNYRLTHTDQMKAAVDACVEAGIGLTAMKTQAGWSWKRETEPAIELKEQFLEKGFSEEQAKLKAVWENPHIASICSHMPNLKILMSNVAAALDKVTLSYQDMRLLEQYAHETASGYCAGCANICESTVNGHVPVSDVMRYLMYCRSYGDRDRARALFNELPLDTRRRMATTEYTMAERRCPQRMSIGRLMKEAIVELS